MTSTLLPIALRAWAAREPTRHPPRRPRPTGPVPWPADVLLLDTETTTDPTQRLLFGSYRHGIWLPDSRLAIMEEGLIYTDDLPARDPDGFRVLRQYVASRVPDLTPGVEAELRRLGYPRVTRTLPLLSRREFVDTVFWHLAYKARAVVVGFNLPFDLSRLAVDCRAARGAFRGGFSLVLWTYPHPITGERCPHPYRPRITVQHLDRHKAFIRFTRPKQRDRADQRPGDGEPPDPRYTFPGRFLDLKTATFALTDRGHSLASACEAFGTEYQKDQAPEHGRITEPYLDYNRHDVRATQALLVALRADFDPLHLPLDPCKAYSPASVAKAGLRQTGLTPPREQFPDVPPDILGQAMSTFYGGRAEGHIRGTPVPVVYTDFTSMYPTVYALLGLWRLLIAERLDVAECTAEAQQFLDTITADRCLDPATWPAFAFFAEIEPAGDILPVRARYGASREWSIGVNPLAADQPFWYAGPDLVASTLLTGRPPRIRRAVRLVPAGQQAGLRPTRLHGETPVDPRRDDLFRMAIEARQRLKRDPRLAEHERNRLDRFLKTFANSGCYGIAAEMNRTVQPESTPVTVTVYGNDGRFLARTRNPEDPGAFCFPPLAALVTAGARCMLALLERCVTDLGGIWAFCDTDSMAIVATATGGLVPCPGGPHRLADGRAAVRALSGAEVQAIVERFATLNPYDRSVVAGSILKVEDVNFTDTTRTVRRQLYAFVISAKRYALFTVGPDRQPVIRDYSEHGLGHLLNPVEPESEDRDWMRQVWERIVREALGLSTDPLPWLDRPALTRTTVSTPLLLRRFDGLNEGKARPDRIKEFNFLLQAHVMRFGYPWGADRARFMLIAPYTTDPGQWEDLTWINLYSGEPYGITTRWSEDELPLPPRMARVQTYRDVLARYLAHPESKSVGPDGRPCGPKTAGLLSRRPIQALTVIYIGKEANQIDERVGGLVGDLDEVQVEYHPDSESDGGDETLRRLMQQISATRLAALSGVSRETISKIRNGHHRPSRATREALAAAVARYVNDPPSDDTLDALRALRAARHDRPWP